MHLYTRLILRKVVIAGNQSKALRFSNAYGYFHISQQNIICDIFDTDAHPQE